MDEDPFLSDLAGVVAEVERVTARAASVDRWRELGGRNLSGAARGRLDALQDAIGRLGTELRRLSITREDHATLKAAWRRLTDTGERA